MLDDDMITEWEDWGLYSKRNGENGREVMVKSKGETVKGEERWKGGGGGGKGIKAIH